MTGMMGKSRQKKEVTTIEKGASGFDFQRWPPPPGASGGKPCTEQLSEAQTVACLEQMKILADRHKKTVAQVTCPASCVSCGRWVFVKHPVIPGVVGEAYPVRSANMLTLLPFASLAIRRLTFKPCYSFLDTDDTAPPSNPRNGRVTSSSPSPSSSLTTTATTTPTSTPTSTSSRT